MVPINPIIEVNDERLPEPKSDRQIFQGREKKEKAITSKNVEEPIHKKEKTLWKTK